MEGEAGGGAQRAAARRVGRSSGQRGAPRAQARARFREGGDGRGGQGGGEARAPHDDEPFGDAVHCIFSSSSCILRPLCIILNLNFLHVDTT